MKSGSAAHEITHCNLLVCILKNQGMLVEIGEEGVGGEKRKITPLPAIHNLSNLLLNAAGGSSMPLSMGHTAISSKTELTWSSCSTKFTAEINMEIREEIKET